MATLATPTALLLGVLLGPALLAVVLDHQPGRPRARSIALCRCGDGMPGCPQGPQRTPIAVRAALEGLSIARAARLRVERAKLVETWGLETLPGDQ